MAAGSRPFRLRKAGSDEVFEVPATTSTILDVLHARGIVHPSSCESGTCGTCKMRVEDGTIEHRDLFLTDAERGSFMMPCVSRAADDEIVLDF